MEVLRPIIDRRGPIPFRQFMELALYHEEHGYYSDPERTRVGRSGDFATNVSVGESFGRLLALRLHQFWLTHGSPAILSVFELGPEDGSLALDILKWSRELDPEFRSALRYHACEHSPRKRAALAARFAECPENNLAATETNKAPPSELGVVLANEVLDALPVDLLHFEAGQWRYRNVALNEQGALCWHDGGAVEDRDEHLVARLGSSFPDGYQSEFCPGYREFLDGLTPLFDHGLFLFIDYGFTHDDYYHPDRTEGTLRTYADHQAGDDPLVSPGRQDISAHVNFTEFIAQAEQLGLRADALARQESYLTHLATPLLPNLPDTPESLSFIRQFRTLTHPGFFGSRFQVLELTK